MIGRSLKGLLVVALVCAWGLPAQAAVRCYQRSGTIFGTAGNDILRGTPRADVIVAGRKRHHPRARGEGPNLRRAGQRCDPWWWS